MNAYKPRNYQTACLDALAAARDQGSSQALIVMASGLGKTITSAFDIKEYLKDSDDSRILVLCHSAAIQRQTKEVFKEIFGDEYSYGMYNYTDKASRRTDFLFANLQSINLHCDEFDPKEFCYIVVDEAHHSPATTYRKAIQHFKPQFLLGMTATPDRTDNAELKDVFGDMVFEYRLESAIRDGWLSEVEYHIKTDEIQHLEYFLDSGERLSLSQLNREIFIPKRDEEIIQIIRSEIAGMDSPTMVIFCQTIAHAEKFAELMGDAVVIHSRLDADTIAERLAGFRAGEIKTVCAVDMLNEGIDVPRTDVIVFLRVTQSKIVFTQQLGRGLRRAEGKDKVLVLDFVATADRLEMLFQLEREFKSSAGKYTCREKDPEREYFNLNMDTPVFKDRIVDIIELIERAREYSCRYTDEELIQMLKAFAEELGRTPTIHDINSDPDMPNTSTYSKRFGAFTDAILAAGLEPNRKYYSDDELLEMLKGLYAELGRTPSMRDVDSNSNMPSAATYAERFGSFTNAVLNAGFEPNSIKAYDDDELLEILKGLYAELGRTPTMQDINSNPNMPNAKIYANHFGSFTKAVLAAGLEPNSIKAYDDDELLEILKGLYAELGRTPSIRDVNSNSNMPSVSAYANHFGSFTKAVLAAGLEPNNIKVYSDDELIEMLKGLYAELGRTPTVKDVDSSPNMPKTTTYTNRFGSFTKAVLAAGLKPNRFSGYSDDELLEMLKGLYAELGRTPTVKDVKANPNIPYASTYVKRFGSFTRAIIAAGLEPNRFYGCNNDELIEMLKGLYAELGRTPTVKDVDSNPNMPSATIYTKRFGSFSKAIIAAGLEPNRKKANSETKPDLKKKKQ